LERCFVEISGRALFAQVFLCYPCPFPPASIFHEQRFDIFQREELDLHVGMPFAEFADLAVLAVDERGTDRGNFQEQIVVGEVKVGSEGLCCSAVLIPFQGKRTWLVLPVNAVKVQKSGDFGFALVGEDSGWPWDCK
jgi:hypothetical protein